MRLRTGNSPPAPRAAGAGGPAFLVHTCKSRSLRSPRRGLAGNGVALFGVSEERRGVGAGEPVTFQLGEAPVAPGGGDLVRGGLAAALQVAADDRSGRGTDLSEDRGGGSRQAAEDRSGRFGGGPPAADVGGLGVARGERGGDRGLNSPGRRAGRGVVVKSAR